LQALASAAYERCVVCRGMDVAESLLAEAGACFAVSLTNERHEPARHGYSAGYAHMFSAFTAVREPARGIGTVASVMRDEKRRSEVPPERSGPKQCSQRAFSYGKAARRCGASLPSECTPFGGVVKDVQFLFQRSIRICEFGERHLLQRNWRAAGAYAVCVSRVTGTVLQSATYLYTQRRIVENSKPLEPLSSRQDVEGGE